MSMFYRGKNNLNNYRLEGLTQRLEEILKEMMCNVIYKIFKDRNSDLF